MNFTTNELVAFITIIAGLVTIVWFIRDVRKQNSKALKSIDQTQLKQSEILLKIEQGQSKGFETLARILERIEKGSEATVKSLEVQTEMLANQTKILAKIEAK